MAKIESGEAPTCPAIAASSDIWGPNPNSGRLERPKTEGFGQPITRAMVRGEVMLQNDPVCPTGGLVTLYIGVLDIDGKPRGGATVSAYLYPKSRPGGGQGINLVRSQRGAYFTGEATLTGAGPWELAVRVKRPRMADAKVYYSLGMSQ
jgi:hypothetical protein